MVAKLAGTEQAFAAAKKCLNADEKTITALEGQAASLKDWLSFYRQQLGITSEEAKVCMNPCNFSSSKLTSMFGQHCSRCMLEQVQ